MIAPDNGKTTTADDLVEALVDKDEYKAVLQYARLRNLEKDNSVLFLVAMLKVFAYVYDRLIKLADILNLRVSTLSEASSFAEQRFAKTVGEHVALLQHLMRDHVGHLGNQAAQMNVAAGEMKVLREQLENVTRDAERTLAAYHHIEEADDAASLTRLFDKRLLAALDQRVPAYDEVFRRIMLETIARGMGRYFLYAQGQTFIIIGVAAGILYLLRR